MSQIIELVNWKFHLGEIKKYEYHSHDVIYDMSKAGKTLGSHDRYIELNEWQDVTVPHDYCIAQDTNRECAPSHGYKPRNIGWYYTKFNLPLLHDEHVLIDFEGVASECIVYVNSTIVCRNFSAYTGFVCDISDYVTEGENIIALRVDSSRWEGWWYEGSGIYRPARVHLKERVYLNPYGTHIKTQKLGDSWKITAECEVVGDGGSVMLRVCDASGKLLWDGAPECVINDAKLWSPDTPYLYTAVVTLCQNGKQMDRETVRFGLRTLEWRHDGGMFLNGEKCFVKGICAHQDHAGVGIAVPHLLVRERIAKLKELGCNLYRCAHHNPSAELLSVCDELGMMVMSENRNFTSSEETLNQVRYLVKNSRNHPSVVIYSLFNEEPWQKEIRGKRIAAKLKAEILKYDTSRAITGAINGAEMINGESAADVLDVMGMNYSIHKYDQLYSLQKKVILGTENGPVFATRGEVNTDKAAQVYGNYADECAAFGQTIEDTLGAAMALDYVAGVCLWSGFDYRGEPQPMEWPSVSSHWGVCDICGFEKDIYYLVKSYYSDKPVVHILPAWEGFADGENVRVAVFTNMESVTLSLNGRVLGTASVKECRAEFTVPFEAGTLTAMASRGGITVSDTLRTPDVKAKIMADVIDDGRYKVINVTVTDKNGIHVNSACDMVNIRVSGGRVIGCGNGDPNDPMPGICETVRVFHGKCQFIIEGVGAKVTLSTDGLDGASVE